MNWEYIAVILTVVTAVFAIYMNSRKLKYDSNVKAVEDALLKSRVEDMLAVYKTVNDNTNKFSEAQIALKKDIEKLESKVESAFEQIEKIHDEVLRVRDKIHELGNKLLQNMADKA